MDNESLDLLKTVCAAGRARAAYDENSNARLEELVKEGLLAEVGTNAGNTSTMPRRSYKPTERGHAVIRRRSGKGAA
jgi:hypothetical protein